MLLSLSAETGPWGETKRERERERERGNCLSLSFLDQIYIPERTNTAKKKEKIFDACVGSEILRMESRILQKGKTIG